MRAMIFSLLIICGLMGCGADPNAGKGGTSGNHDDGMIASGDEGVQGDSGVAEDVGVVDDPTGTGGDDEGGQIDDPGSAEDIPVEPEVAQYPEPGTIEFWLDIIPGTWRQTDPKSGEPWCVDAFASPEDCEGDLDIIPIPPEKEKNCVKESDYKLDGVWIGLCVADDGYVNFRDEVEDDDYWLQYEGQFSEKIIFEGACSEQKSDGTSLSCVRHSDCMSVSPQATCSGMKVEYWMDVCTMSKPEQINCDKNGGEETLGTWRHFLKIK